MVKPPKTMQPEQVDLSKAGRKAGKAFQEDSFRHYMARKIDLQRQQFGQIALPPPPLPKTPPSPSLKPEHPPGTKSILKSPLSMNSNKRKVRFTEPDQQRTRVSESHNVTTDVGSIIHKLEKRHGKLTKRRRLKSSKRKHRNRRRLNPIDGEVVLEELGDCSVTSASEIPPKKEEKRISGPQEDEIIPTSEFSQLHQPSASTTAATSIKGAPSDKVPPDSDSDGDEDESELARIPTSYTSPASIRKSRPDLFFYGVAIKVNGYTDPDNETLKRMIQKHGGQFECYETQRVTHIIAEHLSTAKANIFKRQRNPLPVVSPKWIVDSVAQHCLLPYGKYLIEEVKEPGQQKGIKEMFGSAKTPPGLHAVAAQADSTIRSKSATSFPPTLNASMPEKIARDDAVLAKSSPKLQGTTNHKLVNGSIRTVGTDPNFLQSYFSSSRLSFIGSYKQRATNASSPSKVSRECTSHLERWVFHVDMDCFFASVALRSFPQYKNSPVVISHHGQKNNSVTGNTESEFSVSKKSTSECATCNYKAREFGIKKGMFLGRAKELCPELVILNYDFDGYQEVSEQVSEILYRTAGEHFGSVENVSCDESYVEFLLENHDHAKAIAECIRTEILQVTNCTASVGVAGNKFLAKLGTDTVKPDDSFVVTDYRVLLADLRLRDLPGIGWRSEPKLAAEGLRTVRDVWDLGTNSSPVLRRILGAANGEKISMYCQGKDDRPVEPAKRKTIGAECNYGVRFDGPYGIDHFVTSLADEVQKRMEKVGVRGRHLTLKVKQRKKGAKNPPKFLGHGSCHSLSRSSELPGSRATCDAKVISSAGMDLFNELGIPVDDVRGMGIVISKLSEEPTPSTSELTHWFRASSKKAPPSADSRLTSAINAEHVGNPGDEQDDLRADVQQLSVVEILDDDDASVAEIEDEIPKTRSLTNEQSYHTDMEDAVRNSLICQEAFTQIALPPMSQLRMSQVEEMPTDLQRQIKSRIQQHSNSRQEKHQGAVSVDYPKPHSREAQMENTVRIGKAPISNSKHRSFLSSNDARNQRFRQTDVQQMFNLAAIEAGTKPSGISLDVLNQLPTDLKLQIVNGAIGDCFAGQVVDIEGASFARTGKGDTKSARTIHDASILEAGEDALGSHNVPSDSSLTVEAQVEVPAIDNSPQDIFSSPGATKMKVMETPGDLYEEDILPLKIFLDENCSLDPEAIQLVSQFLTICVREGRSNDMVTMVRRIRKREDGWSEEAVLSQIFEPVDNEYLQLHGARLDREWTMGRKRI